MHGGGVSNRYPAARPPEKLLLVSPLRSASSAVSATACAEAPADDIDRASHRLDDAADVAAELEALRTAAVVLTAHPPAAGALAHCRVHAVDGQSGRFVLETLSPAAPTPGHTVFTAVRPGAKLQFTLDAQWDDTASGLPRFASPLPEDFLRLQRRAFERLDAPLGRDFGAEFIHLGQRFQLAVSDLSAGGIGLRASPRQAAMLRAGLRLPRVRLSLDGAPLAVIDLEVRLCRAFRSYLLGRQVHVGCRFVDPQPSAQAALAQAIDRLGH